MVPALLQVAYLKSGLMKRKLEELKQNCIFVATTNICTYLTYKLWGCGWNQQNSWNSEQITDLEITVCACTCAVVPGSSLFNYWCCIYCILNMEKERLIKSKSADQHNVCCEKLINFSTTYVFSIRQLWVSTIQTDKGVLPI